MPTEKPQEKKKDGMTSEEKEWMAIEDAWNEGYDEGITNFVAVKKEIQKLRKKGIPVMKMDD